MAAFSQISQVGFQIPESLTLFNSLLHSDLGDNELRLLGWENLKQRAPIGPLNIPKMMQEIEQESLNNGKPLVDNVNELFERFAAKLAPEFEVAQVPAEARQVTELQLNALQERLREHYENAALETIWNQALRPLFEEQGAFQDVPYPNGVEAIRAWLNDPANTERIQQVTEIDLQYLQLKTLPSEIGLFIGLQTLSLSNNKLSSLPDSFGNLQALTGLYLSHNQLDSLPDSFGNLRALTGLHVSVNQLSSLPDSFGNLQALTYLNLFGNQLSSLPESFGNLQALRELHLFYNRLSSLPESFGNLRALTEINLCYNHLDSLPESFDNLKALTVLNLSHNHLSHLPETFKNLRGFRYSNLNDNPWMLISDKERSKITDYATYLARFEPLKKYTPQSPLATLFHAIIFNKPVEAIQQAYFQLSPKMQQWIAAIEGQDPNSSRSAQSTAASSSSDPSRSQDSLFTDMGLFARSVRKATYDLYDSLEPELKKLVHWHVWDLAGRPETDDSNWGEHHVFDHVLRFTDALERATQN